VRGQHGRNGSGIDEMLRIEAMIVQQREARRCGCNVSCRPTLIDHEWNRVAIKAVIDQPLR